MEVCYTVGSSALSKGQPGIAIRWLERALKPSLRSGQDSKQSDLTLKDMRLLILHALGERLILILTLRGLLIILVRAHLQLETASSRNSAIQALGSLKNVKQIPRLLPVTNKTRNMEIYSPWSCFNSNFSAKKNIQIIVTIPNVNYPKTHCLAILTSLNRSGNCSMHDGNHRWQFEDVSHRSLSW